MGSIKQKEKINKNPDDDIYCYPMMKTRKQELEDHRKQREFPGLDDDLKSILNKTGGKLIKSVEYLPTTGDSQTYSSDDLKKLNGYQNPKQGRSYTWH